MGAGPGLAQARTLSVDILTPLLLTRSPTKEARQRDVVTLSKIQLQGKSVIFLQILSLVVPLKEQRKEAGERGQGPGQRSNSSFPIWTVSQDARAAKEGRRGGGSHTPPLSTVRQSFLTVGEPSAFRHEKVKGQVCGEASSAPLLPRRSTILDLCLQPLQRG